MKAQYDYENEFAAEIDEKGHLELPNGEKIDLQTAKQNGYDFISISITDQKGNNTEILSEECA